MGKEGAQVIVIILLIILFFAVNINYNNVLWKYFDKLIYMVNESYYKYFSEGCFKMPECSIPMYKQVDCKQIAGECCEAGSKPCLPAPLACSKPCAPASGCAPASVGTCAYQTSVVFGCYYYELDSLPGIIYKYDLDAVGAKVESSKTTLAHSLGILRKIYFKNGKLYVEDSYSVEHQAGYDPITGNLIF